MSESYGEDAVEYRKDMEADEAFHVQENRLRDDFAMRAPLSKFFVPDWRVDDKLIRENAELAYKWADAMLEARKKK